MTSTPFISLVVRQTVVLYKKICILYAYVSAIHSCPFNQLQPRLAFMARTFSAADGLVPVDFAHCGLDHTTAAGALFGSDPSHYDSAGYLAHIGVELLLKSWLLQSLGQFEGIHNLITLYAELELKCGAPTLDEGQLELLTTLDGYEQLRYPNPKQPTEVGGGDWPRIEAFVGFVCNAMPQEIPLALEQVVPGRKAGRVLMKKRRE